MSDETVAQRKNKLDRAIDEIARLSAELREAEAAAGDQEPAEPRKLTADDFKGGVYARTETSPREKAFADAWVAENDPAGRRAMLRALIGRDPTPAEAKLSGRLIQWLGSNVGFGFLIEALRANGESTVPTPTLETLRTSAGRWGRARSAWERLGTALAGTEEGDAS